MHGNIVLEGRVLHLVVDVFPVEVFGKGSGRIGTHPTEHQVQDIATGLLRTEMHLTKGNLVLHLNTACLQNGEQAIGHGRHLLAHHELLLIHLADLGMHLRERFLWQGEVFRLYLRTCLGEGDEVSLLVILVDGYGKELVQPLCPEPLAGATVEVNLHAYGLGQALHLLGREVAPGVEHFKLLLQFVLLVEQGVLLRLQALHLLQEAEGSVVFGSLYT